MMRGSFRDDEDERMAGQLNTASGDAAEIPDHDVLAATAAHLEQWPTGIASRYIVIKPTSLDVAPDEP